MQTYTISRGEKTSAKCTLRTATWEKLVSVFTTHKVGKSKDEHGYFVGGTFANNYRNAENMLSRSLVTIDVDSYEPLTSRFVLCPNASMTKIDVEIFLLVGI